MLLVLRHTTSLSLVRIIALHFCCVLIAGSVSGQTDSLPAPDTIAADTFQAVQSVPDSIQRPYIERFDDYFLVRVGLTNRTLNFNLSPRINGITQYLQRLWYRPGVQNTLGVGVRFKGLGLSYSFKLAQHPLIRARQGNSEYFDIRVNSLGRKFGYDVYYQDYKGYFISNIDLSSVGNLVTSLGNIISGDTLLRRDDLRIQAITGNFYYAFNRDRFSYRGAFVLDERQLRSGGAFFLNGSLGYTKAHADSSFVPEFDTLGFHPNAAYRQADFYTFAATPGYAYNLVIRQKYFAMVGVTGMIGLMYYKGWTGFATDEGFKAYLKGIGRASIGYHGKNWIIGGLMSADINAFNTKHIQYRTNTFTASGFVAYRFKVKWMEGKKSLFEFGKKDKVPAAD